jgi:hypothetical protein
MVEDAVVATMAWPVASSREGVVARPRTLGRVLSRGGLQDVHNDDLPWLDSAGQIGNASHTSKIELAHTLRL